MKRMAHISNGKVVNVSLWDGESDWVPDEDVIEIPEGSQVGVGWDFIDEEFIETYIDPFPPR